MTPCSYIRSKSSFSRFPAAAAVLLATVVSTPLHGQEPVPAKPFVHPGGLHTIEDLERMKSKVAAREAPWIQGWEALLQDPLSRADHRSSAGPNMSRSRQAASRDAHAAYLNFLRWYISGERAHAEAAIRICNDWSGAVREVSKGTDTPGLSGIYAAEFAMVGELLRVCPDWKAEDQERLKRMMREYIYPVVSGFLKDRDKHGDSHFWANWDICNIQALIAMGVLLDDRAIFDEGVRYYKHGRGTGSVMNAIPFLHPGNLGQWQESGRDQPHAHLGIGMLGQAFTIAWNQGEDLFGHADNRLLAAAEYAAREALSMEVPYTPYNNSSGANNYWLTNHTRGRFSTPVWELLYNHYVVRQGHESPALRRVAELSRPELGGWDHFGYGTLTFTLDAEASHYPPLPAPEAPAGLAARPGLGRVYLTWKPAAKQDAAGFIVRRSRAGDDKFETIGDWSKFTTPEFVDLTAEPGVAYRYFVIARNQSGESPPSATVTATAGAAGELPEGWKVGRIGKRGKKPAAGFSRDGSRTMRLTGTGSGIGGKADNAGFLYRKTRGDFVMTARVVGPDPGEISKSPLSMFGFMARESLSADSAMVALTLGEGGLRGTRARFRPARRDNATVHHGNDYSWSPIWYRLTRRGEEFTAEHSVDGEKWFAVGSSKMKLSPDLLLGFTLATRAQDKPGEVLFEFCEIEP